MTDKITFTTNGEQHELPIDGSKTLRPGNVSPDMKLTVTGSFNPPPLITFNQNHQPIMTIHPDGKITLGENAQPTEAAAACIEAMGHMIQDMIKNAVSRQPTQSDALRDLVATLWCASGCSCCRDDDAWEKASHELAELLGIPKYDDGSGYDWYSVCDTAKGQSK